MKKFLIVCILTFFYSCSSEESCEQYPTLTTEEANNITDKSVTLIGKIIPPTCDENVTSQGFVYSKTQLPKVDDNLIEKSGTNISTELENLEQNTTYYVRTFFENTEGVFYGNEIEFKTIVGDAILSLRNIRNITVNSVDVSLAVNSTGGGTILKKGVCYSTTENPTVNDNKLDLSLGNSGGSGTIENLTNYTVYYLKGYVENENGIHYSEQENITTLDYDNDSDGIYNYQDNCIDTPNPEQEDTDGDGIGDVCDDPPLLSINKEKFDINWNDVVKSKQEPYDINNDNIPDIISWQRINNQTVDPPIFYIKDYNGNDVWDFNIKEYNPAIRDSLNNLYFDYHDINNDGNMDFVLQYMGEWHNQTPNPDFYGINTYLLLSKGNLQYDVIEMFDDPDFDSFGIQLFDFDKDGNVDILHKSMQEGEYFKNINNQSFELSNINPLFISELAMKFDWNLDGEIDYVNLGLQNKTLTIVTSSENIVIPFDNTGWTFEFNIDGNPTSWSPERFSIIDGDNDGDWDFVIGGFLKKNNRNYYTQRYFENKNGSFSYIENFIETDHTLIGELQVYVDDIDGDGDDDLYYPFYAESQLNTPREDYGGNAYGPMFWWENTNTGFKINKKFELIY